MHTEPDENYVDERGAMRWSRRAACRSANPVHFFPTHGKPVEALAICASCPVLDECAAYAIERAWLCGVWGGMSERERDRARRDARRTTAA